MLHNAPKLEVMLKAHLLCTSVLNKISETEFWVKKKRSALLVCQAKGNTGASYCRNHLSPLSRREWKFYSSCSESAWSSHNILLLLFFYCHTSVLWTFFWWVGGEVSRGPWSQTSGPTGQVQRTKPNRSGFWSSRPVLCSRPWARGLAPLCGQDG